jgi:hypothetical protein
MGVKLDLKKGKKERKELLIRTFENKGLKRILHNEDLQNLNS